MKKNRLFKKYYLKLIYEGIIKAAVCGLIVGFAVSIIPAVITLIANLVGKPQNEGLWISIGSGLIAFALSTPLFYFLLFKPKNKQIAERVDRLGLDERVITMFELEKDGSYIALKQREDAKRTLSANQRPLKIVLFIIPFIILGVITVSGA